MKAITWRTAQYLADDCAYARARYVNSGSASIGRLRQARVRLGGSAVALPIVHSRSQMKSAFGPLAPSIPACGGRARRGSDGGRRAAGVVVVPLAVLVAVDAGVGEALPRRLRPIAASLGDDAVRGRRPNPIAWLGNTVAPPEPVRRPPWTASAEREVALSKCQSRILLIAACNGRRGSIRQ
jgi:hypothetical protein